MAVAYWIVLAVTAAILFTVSGLVKMPEEKNHSPKAHKIYVAIIFVTFILSFAVGALNVWVIIPTLQKALWGKDAVVFMDGIQIGTTIFSAVFSVIFGVAIWLWAVSLSSTLVNVFVRDNDKNYRRNLRNSEGEQVPTKQIQWDNVRRTVGIVRYVFAFLAVLCFAPHSNWHSATQSSPTTKLFGATQAVTRKYTVTTK